MYKDELLFIYITLGGITLGMITFYYYQLDTQFVYQVGNNKKVIL
jgi:hypothetical protein